MILLERSANHWVDRIQPPCTLVDKIQPACTLVDQQDTIFLAQDARLRPVLQSHSSLWGISRIRSFWFRMQNQFQYFKSSIRLSVLVLLLHLRTIRSLAPPRRESRWVVQPQQFRPLSQPPARPGPPEGAETWPPRPPWNVRRPYPPLRRSNSCETRALRSFAGN